MTSFSVYKQFANNSDAVRAAVKVTILTINSRPRSQCPMGQIPSIHRSYSRLIQQEGRQLAYTATDVM